VSTIQIREPRLDEAAALTELLNAHSRALFGEADLSVDEVSHWFHSFAELARRGASRVGLGVDAQNTTGAVRLYRRAGMHAERTSDIWEKRV
jgi:hypothetical protein